MYPSLRSLPLRELDCLIRRAPTLPEAPPRLLELSQSLGRHSASAGDVVKTLLPKGNVMHTGRVVPLLGFECLRVQGFWLIESLEALLGDRMMREMAGNMFDLT